MEKCSRYSDYVSDWTVRGPNPGREKRYYSSKYLNWSWGPHSPLFNSLRGSSPVVKWSEHHVNHFQLPPRLRMSGAAPPFSYMPSWRGQRKLYLCILNMHFLFYTRQALNGPAGWLRLETSDRKPRVSFLKVTGNPGFDSWRWQETQGLILEGGRKPRVWFLKVTENPGFDSWRWQETQGVILEGGTQSSLCLLNRDGSAARQTSYAMYTRHRMIPRGWSGRSRKIISRFESNIY
jgi:hypothetical protein